MRLVSTFVVLMVGCLGGAIGCSDGPRESAISEEEAALSSFTFAGPTVVPVEEQLFGTWDGEDGRVLTLETSRLFKLESPCDADAGPCAAPITGRWSGVLERAVLADGNRKALLFGAQYVPSDTIGTIDRLNDPNGGLHWFWFRQDAAGASSLVGSTSLPAGGTVGRFTKRPAPLPSP
jgi:hypothetical protein